MIYTIWAAWSLFIIHSSYQNYTKEEPHIDQTIQSHQRHTLKELDNMKKYRRN